MAEREELDTMWEHIRSLEQDSLKVACNTAAFEVQFVHNWVLTTLVLFKPAELEAYINYMKPKTEAAQKAALGASGVEETFDIAFDFQNDCLAYLRSRLKG